MRKKIKNLALCVQPVPQTIVSCRDKEGKNNALVVGFTANVSLSPAMVMVGIVPDRYSHHMVKEAGCFIINFPAENFKKEYDYLGSHSGRNEDKFEKLNLKYTDGEKVNAPVLTDCPVSVECTIVECSKPGTHELFIGKVECVHCDEKYLDDNDNIMWDKLGIK